MISKETRPFWDPGYQVVVRFRFSAIAGVRDRVRVKREGKGEIGNASN